MALIKMTVSKFAVGDKTFSDKYGSFSDNDNNFLYDIEDTTNPIPEQHVEVKDTFWKQDPVLVNVEFISENYYIKTDVITSEFCGEPLSGVSFEIDSIGIDDALGFQEMKQTFVDIAIAAVEQLCAKRKQTIPNSWTYSYLTAWSYWSENYGMDYDSGCEYHGVVNVEKFTKDNMVRILDKGSD